MKIEIPTQINPPEVPIKLVKIPNPKAPKISPSFPANSCTQAICPLSCVWVYSPTKAVEIGFKSAIQSEIANVRMTVSTKPFNAQRRT